YLTYLAMAAYAGDGVTGRVLSVSVIPSKEVTFHRYPFERHALPIFEDEWMRLRRLGPGNVVNESSLVGMDRTGKSIVHTSHQDRRKKNAVQGNRNRMLTYLGF